MMWQYLVLPAVKYLKGKFVLLFELYSGTATTFSAAIA